MLTKNDLEQIRGVVRDEVKSEVSSQINGVKTDVGLIKKEVTTFRTEVNTKIEVIKADLNDVKTDISGVKADLNDVKTDIKKQVLASENRIGRKLRKMQNSILQYHDEYAIYLRERIEKLKEHTGLAKPKQN